METTLKDEYVKSLLALTHKFEDITGVTVLNIHFRRISDTGCDQISEKFLIRDIILEMK